MNEFTKVTGYKINTQKSLASLYTYNNKSERKIKEKISLIIATKRIKNIRISLLKETKDLYAENYKIPMKDDTKQVKRYIMFLDWKNKNCEN